MVLPFQAAAIGRSLASILEYSVSPGVSEIIPNSSVIFSISTQNVIAGTVIPYQISGTITAGELVSGSLTGTVTTGTNGQGILTVTTTAGVTIGRTIIFNLLKNASAGVTADNILATAQTVTVVSTGSTVYSITAPNIVNAGASIPFTFTKNPNPGSTTIAIRLVTGDPNWFANPLWMNNTSYTIFNPFTQGSGSIGLSPIVEGPGAVPNGSQIVLGFSLDSITNPVVATTGAITVQNNQGPTNPEQPELPPNMLALFSNNEGGAWYDPSDPVTIFKDLNGTPATLEQPVRLMLDKRKGLASGLERITYGVGNAWGTVWNKGSPGEGYTGIPNIIGNKLIIDVPASPIYNVAYQGLSSYSKALEPFKVYKLTFTISDYVEGGIRFVLFNNPTYIMAGAPANLPAGFKNNGSFSAYIIIGNTYPDWLNATVLNSERMNLQYFQIQAIGKTKLSLSNLSLREIQGNHAFALPWYPFETEQLAYDPPILSRRYNLINTNTSSWVSGTSFTMTLGVPGNSSLSGTRLSPRKPLILYFTGSGTVTVTFSGSSTTTYTSDGAPHTIQVPANLASPYTFTMISSGVVNTVDLRYGNYGSTVPMYQEVTSSTSYATNGFPPYLQFGSDFTSQDTACSALFTLPKFFPDNTSKLGIWVGTYDSGTEFGNYLSMMWSAGEKTKIPRSGVPFADENALFRLFTSLASSTYAMYTEKKTGYCWRGTAQTTNINFGYPNNLILYSSINLNVLNATGQTFRINGIPTNYENWTIEPAGTTPSNYGPPLDNTFTMLIGAQYWSGYTQAAGGGPKKGIKGKLYGLILRTGESTAAQINTVGSYINNKMGLGFWTDNP